MRNLIKISIHASRGGSDEIHDDVVLVLHISIHASRGGSDRAQLGALWALRNFNPRFPRGKRRLQRQLRNDMLPISIHASRGGSDQQFPDKTSAYAEISIHASRGGSDTSASSLNLTQPEFQSTLPAGEATPYMVAITGADWISIHASRGGSDKPCKPSKANDGNFNPRFPRGKRRRYKQ